VLPNGLGKKALASKLAANPSWAIPGVPLTPQTLLRNQSKTKLAAAIPQPADSTKGSTSINWLTGKAAPFQHGVKKSEAVADDPVLSGCAGAGTRGAGGPAASAGVIDSQTV